MIKAESLDLAFDADDGARVTCICLKRVVKGKHDGDGSR